MTTASFESRRVLTRPVSSVIALLAAVMLTLAGCSDTDEDQSTNGDQLPDTTTSTTAVSADASGVFEDRILFGQSAAFSGPAEALGHNMRIGIEAAFQEVNDAGGVHGRQLRLVSLDDSYEPEAAIANTKTLIEQEEVFALIGAVGTPTSRSATPVASDAGVPYIAPFTGAAFLRELDIQDVINVRSSYNQETEEMVARLIGDLGIDRIAILYQDDSFGRAGYRGARDALQRRGLEPVAIGLYPRNTTAVKTALVDLSRGDPDAVIMVGAYEPVATLIKWANATGLDATFMTVSFVGSNALADELGSEGAGVLVTQVVPFPTDARVPIVDRYLDAVEAYDETVTPGFVSLEGYIAGRLAIYGLENCGPDVDRACIAESLVQAGTIDLDGFKLAFGDDDNQGSDEVFLTVIGSDSRYHPVDNLNDVDQWQRG